MTTDEALKEIQDQVQQNRENGETDLRGILYTIETLRKKVKADNPMVENLENIQKSLPLIVAQCGVILHLKESLQYISAMSNPAHMPCDEIGIPVTDYCPVCYAKAALVKFEAQISANQNDQRDCSEPRPCAPPPEMSAAELEAQAIADEREFRNPSSDENKA